MTLSLISLHRYLPVDGGGIIFINRSSDIVITLRASATGHSQIKQARLEKGWPVNDFRWLTAASQSLGTDWEEAGVLASGISEGTWKRFLAGKVPINAVAFKAYCQVLGLDWQSVVETASADVSAPSYSTHPHSEPDEPGETSGAALRQDWGSAPDVSVFYGRQTELETLRTWIDRDRCRLITLLGMGGIGKTALATRVAREWVGAGVARWQGGRVAGWENPENPNPLPSYSTTQRPIYPSTHPPIHPPTHLPTSSGDRSATPPLPPTS